MTGHGLGLGLGRLSQRSRYQIVKDSGPQKHNNHVLFGRNSLIVIVIVIVMTITMLMMTMRYLDPVGVKLDRFQSAAIQVCNKHVAANPKTSS